MRNGIHWPQLNGFNIHSIKEGPQFSRSLVYSPLSQMIDRIAPSLLRDFFFYYSANAQKCLTLKDE